MSLRRGGVAAGLLLAIAGAGLLGCSIADIYGERATVYNLQAEQAHDQGLLLNIVRASKRRPRQYSLVQKITGQASVQGSANVTFPFGPAGSHINTAVLGGGANGGPNFDVVTLESSEAYSGILQPIDARLFDLYVHGEFPHDLLFNLFIEKIVMKRTDRACIGSHLPTCEVTFQNYPGVDLQLELFQSLVGYLINLGLSTESVAPTSGKPQKAAADKKDKKSKSNGDGDGGNDSASAKIYTFCFAPRYPEAAALVPKYLICGDIGSSKQLPELGRRSLLGSIVIHPDFGHDLAYILNRHAGEDNASGFEGIEQFSGRKVSLAIYTRSTETAIYYVGEIVRRGLYADLNEPRTIKIKTGPPFAIKFPPAPCSLEEPAPPWKCQAIFVLDKGVGPGLVDAHSVNYEGIQYSIPDAPRAGSSYDTAAGASYTVLSVLR